MKKIRWLVLFWSVISYNVCGAQLLEPPTQVSDFNNIGLMGVGPPAFVPQRDVAILSANKNVQQTQLFSVSTRNMCQKPQQLALDIPSTSISGVRSPYIVTPDGSTLIYRLDAKADQIQELYAVPVTGGASRKLHPDFSSIPGAAGVGRNYRVTSDGKKLVYIRLHLPISDSKIMVVPVDSSSAPIELAGIREGELVKSVDLLSDFTISADNKYLVYQIQTRPPLSFNLYSVPLDGSRPAKKINANLSAGQTVNRYALTADGKYVIYLSDEGTEDTFELFRAPVDASSPAVKLSGPTEFLSTVRSRFAITADDQRVVFISDRITRRKNELFSVAISGATPPVRINTDIADDRDVQFFVVSPDGQRVIYVADADTGSARNLYSVPVAGGAAAVQLNPQLVEGGIIRRPKFLADGSRVVYMADQDIAGVIELYSVPATGGQTTKLHPTLSAPFGVAAYWLTEDSKWVVYYSDREVDGEFNIYRAASNGLGLNEKINAPLKTGTVVFESSVVVNNDYIIYAAQHSNTPAREFHLVPQSSENALSNKDCSVFFVIKAKNGNLSVIYL